MSINANVMAEAEDLVDGMNQTKKIKTVRKDKSLIERTEVGDEKVIIVEDNRELLLG
jgi:hypothetical protein